jgi:hypothetical protein
MPHRLHHHPKLGRQASMIMQGGIIVTGSVAAGLHRKLIITLAARHRLPAVYAFGFSVADGGLIAYRPDFLDQYRAAAGYVRRHACAGADEISAGDQSQDRKGAWHHHPANPARSPMK